MTRAAIPILTSIAELAPSCDAWIVDIWGVMHNGRRAFEAAGEACRRFRAARRPRRAALQRAAALHRRDRPHDLARRRPCRLRHRRDLRRCDTDHDRGLGRPAAAAYRPGARPRAVRRPRRQDGPGRGRGGDRLLGPVRRHQGDARRLRRAVRPPRRPPPADDLRQSGPGGGARRDARLLRRLAGCGLRGQGRGGRSTPASRTCPSTSAPSPRSTASAAGPCRRSACSPSATASTPTSPARMRRACARSSSPAPCTCRASSTRAALAELFAPRPFAPRSPRCRRWCGDDRCQTLRV